MIETPLQSRGVFRIANFIQCVVKPPALAVRSVNSYHPGAVRRGFLYLSQILLPQISKENQRIILFNPFFSDIFSNKEEKKEGDALKDEPD